MIIIHAYAPPSAEMWHLVISGMRNSWESWEKGDSIFIPADWDVMLGPATFILGNADKALAQRLTLTGNDHGKYLRQLPVILDVTAPEYFWREFDTYHIGVVSNSTSMMHTLGKHAFGAEMFAWDDVPERMQADMLHILNDLRLAWIESGRRKGPEAREWRALVQAVPDAWLYRRAISLNYQVLRHMYFARRHHRLAEWRTFCEWITTLPYSELITVE